MSARQEQRGGLCCGELCLLFLLLAPFIPVAATNGLLWLGVEFSFPSDLENKHKLVMLLLSLPPLFSPVSLLPHISHELYFIFAWYHLLASCALQCFWFSIGYEDFEATVLQLFVSISAAYIFCLFLMSSIVFHLERRTILTPCNGIPEYQCGNSVVWQKANLFCRNANRVLILGIHLSVAVPWPCPALSV